MVPLVLEFDLLLFFFSTSATHFLKCGEFVPEDVGSSSTIAGISKMKAHTNPLTKRTLLILWFEILILNQ